MLYSSIFTTYAYISCPCFSPQSTFLNSARITYFLYVGDVLIPQPMFYSLSLYDFYLRKTAPGTATSHLWDIHSYETFGLRRPCFHSTIQLKIEAKQFFINTMQ